jgi:hypothetical protein
VRGRTLGSVVNLFLQVKVNDENGSKTIVHDFIQNAQAKIWKDDSYTKYDI